MTEAETLKKSRFAVALALRLWHGLPAALAGLVAVIPTGRRYDLTALSAQGDPAAGVVGFFEHTRAAFGQLQERGRGIRRGGGDQSGP
jgi:hypothetical protein